jgi:molybdopterin-guanine dinucleotide biosynthesis protein A
MQNAPQPDLRTAAIILCGGLSTRMGTPKALLQIGDETFLQRIVRINREVFDLVCVVAAQGQELPPLPPEVEIIRDSAPNRGPLQGIYDGMLHLKDRADAAFVCACDMPLLTADAIRFIVSKFDDCEIAIPEVEGHHQPLAAVYRLKLSDRIRDMVGNPGAGPSDLILAAKARSISSDELRHVDPQPTTLSSIDTPKIWTSVLYQSKKR